MIKSMLWRATRVPMTMCVCLVLANGIVLHGYYDRFLWAGISAAASRVEIAILEHLDNAVTFSHLKWNVQLYIKKSLLPSIPM